MHLVTMIVDNFKSYRGRVEFGDLDRNTNVINSAYVGKTNLFDALLFVLGTVRNVDSLDDLIYKKGSYCATKAVVTPCLTTGTRPRRRPASSNERLTVAGAGNGRQEQVPDQREEHAAAARGQPLPLRPARRQQPE